MRASAACRGASHYFYDTRRAATVAVRLALLISLHLQEACLRVRSEVPADIDFYGILMVEKGTEKNLTSLDKR